MRLDTNTKDKDRLLLAMLPHVVFDGWSLKSLAAGRSDLKGEVLETSIIFPGGMRDVAAHFGDYIDRAMLVKLGKIDFSNLSIRERISASVLWRLRLLSPYKEAVRRLLSFLALPGNYPVGMKITIKTVDLIWYTAGDTATDFNYYTKRGLLGGIYGLTILYWLSDTSQNFEETELFLAQRLNGVMQIPKLRSKIAKYLDRIGGPLNFFKRSIE